MINLKEVVEGWRESTRKIRATVRAETLAEVAGTIESELARHKHKLEENTGFSGAGPAGAVKALEELKEELGL